MRVVRGRLVRSKDNHLHSEVVEQMSSYRGLVKLVGDD